MFRVIDEILEGLQLLKKSPTFRKSKIYYHNNKEPAAVTCPKPDETNPNSPYIFKYIFNIIPISDSEF
jgi:hypothetical protein